MLFFAVLTFVFVIGFVEIINAKNINPYTINLQQESNQKVYLSEISTENNSNVQTTNQTYLFIENDLIYNKTNINIYNRKLDKAIFYDEIKKINFVKLSNKELKGYHILGLLHQNMEFGYYIFLTGEENNYCLTTLDKKLNLISNQKILLRTQTLKDNINFKITKDIHSKKLYLLLENSLILVNYSAKDLKVNLIDNNVIQISENAQKQCLIYAKENGNFLNLFKVEKGLKTEITNIDFGYNLKIAFEKVSNNIYCYVLNGFENSVLLNVIRINVSQDIKKEKLWLAGNLSEFNFINISSDLQSSDINLLENKSQKTKQNLNIYKFENSSKIRSLKQISSFENEGNNSKLIRVKYIDNKIFMIYSNSIMLFNSELDLLAEDFFNFNLIEYNPLKNDKEYFQTQFIDQQILINQGNNSYIFELSRNNFWYFNRLYEDIGKYLFPIIAILFILFLYRKNRKNKRLINTLLELPGAGFILVFDKDGNLTIANNASRDILRLDYNVPMNRFFKFYCDNELNLPLFNFFQKALETKHNLSQRVNLIIDNKVREYFCNTLVLRNVAGNFKGLIITGIDITEELERQRLINWAQLAHDLQTNLSIIKLNAENLESLVSIDHKPRVEKISQQANIIFHRIRDLVTVGSSRSINKHSYHSIDLVDEIIGEFDLSLIPNINISKNVKNFEVFCDKPKLIRCVRNATENSIKVLKQVGGEITIKCYIDDKYAVFVVEDNGPGMDEDIKKRMLSPFFTTNQDDGGSGIGTMIMLNVMEQHGGKLLVESEKGKGTKMIFRFPSIQS